MSTIKHLISIKNNFRYHSKTVYRYERCTNNTATFQLQSTQKRQLFAYLLRLKKLSLYSCINYSKCEINVCQIRAIEKLSIIPSATPVAWGIRIQPTFALVRVVRDVNCPNHRM